MPVKYCLAGASADILCIRVQNPWIQKDSENLTSNLEFCDVAKKGDPKFRYQLTTQFYGYFLWLKYIFWLIFIFPKSVEFDEKIYVDIFASPFRVYNFFSRLFLCASGPLEFLFDSKFLFFNFLDAKISFKIRKIKFQKLFVPKYLLKTYV